MPKNQAESHETPQKASSRFWKRCFRVGLILLIGFGFTVWICLFRDTPLEISKETTYATKPLTADGKRVDYFQALEQALYPPNMKTDENGYRLIVQTLGLKTTSYFSLLSKEKELCRKDIYQKLGLDPNAKPTMTYENPINLLRSFDINFDEKPEEYSVLLLYYNPYGNWIPQERARVIEWQKTNGAALDVVAKAVRKPTFCIPLSKYNAEEPLRELKWRNTKLRPPQAQLHEYELGFMIRANYRIAIGDIDGAIDDIVSCHALERWAGKPQCLGETNRAFYPEEYAHLLGIADSLEHQPTEAQLKRLQAELQKLPPRNTIRELAQTERYITLDSLQNLTQGEGQIEDFFRLSTRNYIPIPIQKRILGLNWNVMASTMNAYYNDPLAFKKHWTPYGTGKPVETLGTGFLFPSSRTEVVATYAAVDLLHDLDGVKKKLDELKCADHLQVISLAMLIYEKQHGHLPPAYTVDKDGKPLHSWRVLLLPYLAIEEAENLYEKIRLDEPWDSEHNRQFHNAAVDFYQCPTSELKPGQTTYSVALGEKTAFQGNQGKKLDQFGPDSTSLILVFETDMPACWMDPTSDLSEEDAVQSFSKPIHSGATLAGLRSGKIEELFHLEAHPGISTLDENIRHLHLLEGTAKELAWPGRLWH